MTVFIGKTIDFNNEHADFLKDSDVAKDIFNYINEKLFEEFKDQDKNNYFSTPVLKGFLENIIKHDLPLQAVSKIDHKWLINNNNSEDVKDIYFKIFFPSEADLQQHKEQIEEAQVMVKSILVHINTWIFKQKYDSVDYLKKEFIKKYSIETDTKNEKRFLARI